jgi:threonine/homoserine/homoserine lactone efflux protein
MSSFATGFLAGIPLMIMVGPIAVLLVETGLGHGFRRAWPAGVGVAAADLTFAMGAAIGGATLIHALDRWAPTLRATAVVVLAAVGLHLLIRAVRRPSAGAEAIAGGNGFVTTSTPDPTAPSPRPRAGRRLAPRFYALTLANPLTIVAFTSLVLAGGVDREPRAWALGIASASLLVHVSLVAIGSGLGAVLGDRMQRGLRVAGGLAVVSMSIGMLVTH